MLALEGDETERRILHAVRAKRTCTPSQPRRSAIIVATPCRLAPPIVTAPRFVPLYLAFASGYLLSYLYRTVNAVISPELSAALSVSASSLGLLTSAYFIAFAAMQLPAGMLLDRYGPRRVEPILLA